MLHGKNINIIPNGSTSFEHLVWSLCQVSQLVYHPTLQVCSGEGIWMQFVLDQFDNIVTNVVSWHTTPRVFHRPERWCKHFLDIVRSFELLARARQNFLPHIDPEKVSLAKESWARARLEQHLLYDSRNTVTWTLPNLHILHTPVPFVDEALAMVTFFASFFPFAFLWQHRKTDQAVGFFEASSWFSNDSLFAVPFGHLRRRQTLTACKKSATFSPWCSPSDLVGEKVLKEVVKNPDHATSHATGCVELKVSDNIQYNNGPQYTSIYINMHCHINIW